MPSYERSQSSKLWSVRFRLNSGGKEVNKRLSGYRTQKEAEQAYLAFLAQEKPDKLADHGLLFEALVEAYLAYLRQNTKESTVYDTDHKIRNRILPYFQGRRVANIKPLDVQMWMDTLSEYSYKYRLGLRGHLSALLRYADRYYDIPTIMNKVAPLRNTEPKKEMLFWTEDEFRRFIQCIPVKYPAHRMYFLTLYLVGCRKSEALALTWKDIDLDNGLISITKSITRKIDGAPYKVMTPYSPANLKTTAKVVVFSLVSVYFDSFYTPTR